VTTLSTLSHVVLSIVIICFLAGCGQGVDTEVPNVDSDIDADTLADSEDGNGYDDVDVPGDADDDISETGVVDADISDTDSFDSDLASDAEADSDVDPSFCGNGLVEDGENCDVSIPRNEEGACPEECDDHDICTVDTLEGIECQSECLFVEIVDYIDNDSCCPAGGNSTLDDDCSIVCGNSIVEEGESCDTGIFPDEVGACPISCDDEQVCTDDSVLSSDTCDAECIYEEIIDFVDDDGCCPQGADFNTDNDCSPTCGDGFVDDNEECDTAILSDFEGTCPVECNDDDDCTNDSILSADTCNAVCCYVEVVVPINVDGCCPESGHA
jgi:hypothetical protein